MQYTLIEVEIILKFSFCIYLDRLSYWKLILIVCKNLLNCRIIMKTECFVWIGNDNSCGFDNWDPSQSRNIKPPQSIHISFTIKENINQSIHYSGHKIIKYHSHIIALFLYSAILKWNNDRLVQMEPLQSFSGKICTAI